jgi:hypothetical protein
VDVGIRCWCGVGQTEESSGEDDIDVETHFVEMEVGRYRVEDYFACGMWLILEDDRNRSMRAFDGVLIICHIALAFLKIKTCFKHTIVD